MKAITGISDSPNQTLAFTLDDGSRVSMTLRYVAQQACWFYDLTWGAFTVQGNIIVCGPNILRQYREIIPFGIGVATASNVEVLNVTDFTDGTADLELLDQTDVAQIEAQIYPGL